MHDDAQIEVDVDFLEAMVCSKCGEHISLEGVQPFSDIACPSCGQKQPVPVKLGHFYLLEELGKGGMGAVYKALDQTLGRYVAFKVMRKEMGDDHVALENFLREARAAAALNHRNIVQVYSCGQEKGQPYIVMELVGGGRLDLEMAAAGPLGEARVMQVAVAVAEGLGAAHEMGLVHGDIKPANILFGRKGEPKVVDFGLARFVASQQAPGEVWGTPFYIAPEKAQRQPEDHRSDIYSLGATLFHALCGRAPFDGETPTDVVLARLEAPAPDVREFRPDVHPETAEVIARMLEREPGRRYPTYTSLLSDLRVAERAAGQGPVSVAGQGKRGVRLVLWLVLALLMLAGAGGGGFYLWSQRQVPDSAAEPKPVKYIFRNGKMVPVYADATAPSEPQPDAEAGLSAKPEESPPQVPVAMPAEQLEALRTQLDALAAGEFKAAEQGLAGLAEAMPPEEAGQRWVRLFQGVAALLQGEPDVLQTAFDEVATTTVPGPVGGRLHPAHFPQEVALFMTTDMTTVDFLGQPERRPSWFADLATFFAGVKQLWRGDPQSAPGLLANYEVAKPDPRAAWVYQLQPLVPKLRAEAEAWKAAEAQAGQRQSVGESEAAVAVYETFAGEHPLFARLVPPRVEALQAAAEEEARAREEAAREAEATKALAQEELARVASARKGAVSLVARNDFSGAARQFDQAVADLQTEAGKARRTAVSEGYDQLADLKRFLINEIEKKPFGERARKALPGPVLGANKDGLRIGLSGGGGEALYAWNRVNIRLFTSLAKTYIASSDLPAAGKATHWVALSLFAHENGGTDLAGKLARRAIEADPSARELVDHFMPGLL